MFFTPDSARGSFVAHFTQNPVSDFGIWARGYLKLEEVTGGRAE